MPTTMIRKRVEAYCTRCHEIEVDMMVFGKYPKKVELHTMPDGEVLCTEHRRQYGHNHMTPRSQEKLDRRFDSALDRAFEALGLDDD